MQIKAGYSGNLKIVYAKKIDRDQNAAKNFRILQLDTIFFVHVSLLSLNTFRMRYCSHSQHRQTNQN